MKFSVAHAAVFDCNQAVRRFGVIGPDAGHAPLEPVGQPCDFVPAPEITFQGKIPDRRNRLLLPDHNPPPLRFVRAEYCTDFFAEQAVSLIMHGIVIICRTVSCAGTPEMKHNIPEENFQGPGCRKTEFIPCRGSGSPLFLRAARRMRCRFRPGRRMPAEGLRRSPPASGAGRCRVRPLSPPFRR